MGGLMFLLIKDMLDMPPDGRQLTVKGWVRTKRETKNLTFLQINDGSCFASMQVTFDTADSSSTNGILKKITTGAAVKITGRLQASPGAEQAAEVAGSTIEIYGESPADTYPLQKKHHSFEFLREVAHLRPRTNTFGAVARIRSKMSYAIHTFFQERGFHYVHTPIITAFDGEGAGETFHVTTFNIEQKIKEALKAGINPDTFSLDYGSDFFGKPVNLTVTGQLEGEAYATAVSRIYTFGPTFRAENSNTTRHLSEFWMIEPEMAFFELAENMQLAEDFIVFLLRFALEHCRADLEFFNTRIQPGLFDMIEAAVSKPFQHITYTDAVAELTKHADKFEFAPSWGCDLQSEHEKFLTETVYNGPVVVTDYPKEIKAFYMKLNDDGKTVRAMDVLVPALGEIIGGSERENRLDYLEQRIDECGFDRRSYWWYLDLRRYGSVPHSGFGLGFERLLQYLTGMKNIRDVIPFPRTPKQADF